MAEKPGFHVDDDWKAQAREEKKRLAEEAARKGQGGEASGPAAGLRQEVGGAARVVPTEEWSGGSGGGGEIEGGGFGGDVGAMTGSAAGAGAAPGGAAGGRRARRGRGELPPPTFETLVQTLAGQAMIYLGGGATAGGEPIIDLDTARHQIELLATLESKTSGNLSEAEQQTLDISLYEARSRFCSVAQRYIL